MSKIVFFAFKGDTMCFSHILLNAIDMKDKGNDVRIVMEGESVNLIKELMESNNILFKKAMDYNLIECVCKACSAKMGVLEYNECSPIKVRGEMRGHPAMESYTQHGYQIITL